MKPACKLRGLAFALALTAIPVSSLAATLLPTTGTAPKATATNLTTIGTINWAAWDYRTNAASLSFAPTTVKTTGVGTISAITSTNGVNARGHTNMDSYEATGVFTFTDGTGLAAASDALIGGIFNSGLDQTSNGVQFTIGNLAPLIGGQLYQINVYSSAYRGTATVLATLGGTSVSQAGNPNASPTDQTPDLFQFFYNPDTIGDILTISTLLSANTTTNDSSHASILAVAITVVPEVSSTMLVLLGGSGLLGIRRRK